MSKRKCFISAAYGEELKMLQRVLDRLDVAWEWAVSTSVSQPILNSVVEAIKKTNFVVGVLNDRSPRENVMLELGMAIGLGKPLLLFKAGQTVVPPNFPVFPFCN
jgi:predicted nucleotide-binding protein